MRADTLLHTLARMLLRACSPEQAHALLLRIGCRFPAHLAPSDVRVAANRLSTRGTCFSRALALAARTPASEVVIGVDLRPGNQLRAHAWLEIAGKPLEGSEPSGVEIARLRGRTVAR